MIEVHPKVKEEELHFVTKDIEEVFNEIDKNLKPNIYLVQIMKTDNKIFVYPETDIFKKCLEQIKNIVEGSGVNDQLGGTIKEIFYTEINNEDSKEKCFCSRVISTDEQISLLVLCCNKEAYEVQPQLSNATEYNSILSSITLEYLNQSIDLMKSLFERGMEEFEIDLHIVFRKASENFMKRISAPFLEHAPKSTNIFHTLNAISALRYEGNEGIGQLVLAAKDHRNIEVNLKLEKPIKLTESKAIRKLLEIASENFKLLSDGEFVYGFGKMVYRYNTEAENLFVVNFLSHYTWELIHYSSHKMMKATYGQPIVKNNFIGRNEFEEKLKEVFEKPQIDNFAKLWALVEAAKKQKHGTILAILESAQEEAERLATQCIKVHPMELSDEMMELVSSIDGAVLVDLDANIHAMGVILDGVVSQKGDASRGARYNSAVRYVEMIEHKCILVVVSEDKDIELIKSEDKDKDKDKDKDVELVKS
ncbi:diadenylate cyclase [Bacillus cereus]|nr:MULTISPECIES: diadenylate cyclase [Bacillus cereus group]EEL73232.1 hypothetical protein bcere0027_55510 [Bacillus cereus AH676]EOP99046.1 hypothetical protein IIY_05091 [Bacillus cereus VD140]KMP82836.1 hypothetical protein TU56_03840 [Bacillus cereus]KMQ24770.1 hypothetical protein TU69_13370 [Bacillus cereus]KZD26231.1 hypothetical protein B4081_5421 [Bacillus cereus]